jgi:hypothetical protein
MILNDKLNRQVSSILMNPRPIYVKCSKNDSKYNPAWKQANPLLFDLFTWPHKKNLSFFFLLIVSHLTIS